MTLAAGRRKADYWATCPECFRERRVYSPAESAALTGVMKPHNRWFLDPSPYGSMIYCKGSLQKPLRALLI